MSSPPPPPPWFSVPRLPNRHLSGESTSGRLRKSRCFSRQHCLVIFFLRTLPARGRATGTGPATPQRSALLGVNKAINFQVQGVCNVFFRQESPFLLGNNKVGNNFWKVTNNELYSTIFLPLAGGAPSGTCASGFGVCCVFILGCGGMTNENCTFIVQAASTAIDNPCTYTICPCGSNICRIRLDFNVSVPVQHSRNF